MYFFYCCAGTYNEAKTKLERLKQESDVFTESELMAERDVQHRKSKLEEKYESRNLRNKKENVPVASDK